MSETILQIQVAWAMMCLSYAAASPSGLHIHCSQLWALAGDLSYPAQRTIDLLSRACLQASIQNPALHVELHFAEHAQKDKALGITWPKEIFKQSKTSTCNTPSPSREQINKPALEKKRKERENHLKPHRERCQRCAPEYLQGKSIPELQPLSRDVPNAYSLQFIPCDGQQLQLSNPTNLSCWAGTCSLRLADLILFKPFNTKGQILSYYEVAQLHGLQWGSVNLHQLRIWFRQYTFQVHLLNNGKEKERIMCSIPGEIGFLFLFLFGLLT